ncbi:hypothetical protein [Mesorhizobium sp. M0895]|uniref:hypothetical protein n=1 Tax=Mesorhizobium sp. M0895 TaxID=2957019 RepID=UPI00333D1C7E
MLSEQRLESVARQIGDLFDQRLGAVNFFSSVRPRAWATTAPIHDATYVAELLALVKAANRDGWLGELVDRLIAKFPARTELVDLQAEIGAAAKQASMFGAAGEASELKTAPLPERLHELTRVQKIALIRTLTPKAVPAYMAPDLWPVFADATDMMSAVDLVQQANNLRCAADPHFEPRAISLVHLPTHGGDVGAYWSTAFSRAATKGARTLAALLLAAPAPLQAAHEDLFRSTLQTLREAK